MDGFEVGLLCEEVDLLDCSHLCFGELVQETPGIGALSLVWGSGLVGSR